ncbi:hypothetical protein BDQ17DRAFT_1323675 [Cyathus striatus]|nr:hypothetical protein BDQ17DRAFT_1323675 [Cyathus striatus]
MPESKKPRPTFLFDKLGSQLLAALFSNVFYGIAICMVLQYLYSHAHRDRLRTKLLVCLLAASATLDAICVNIQIFEILVLSFSSTKLYSGKIRLVFIIMVLQLGAGKTPHSPFLYNLNLYSMLRVYGLQIRRGRIVEQNICRFSRLLAVPVVSAEQCHQPPQSILTLKNGAQVEVMRMAVTYRVLAKKVVMLKWAAATSNLTWLINTYLHVMSVISMIIPRFGTDAPLSTMPRPYPLAGSSMKITNAAELRYRWMVKLLDLTDDDVKGGKRPVYGIAICMIVQYFYFHADQDRLGIRLLVCFLAASATLEVLFVNIQMFYILVLSFLTYDADDGIIHYSVLVQYIHTISSFQLTNTSFRENFMQREYGLLTELMLSWSTYGSHLRQLKAFGDTCGFTFNNAAMCWTRSALHIITNLTSASSLTFKFQLLAQVIIMKISVTFNVLSEKIELLRKIVVFQGSATTICDIVITASIAHILRTSRTGVRRTDSVLEKLTKFAIRWAAVTSICSALTIFLFYFCSGDFLFNLTWLVNTHLHVMSVISVLISRKGLRGQIDRSFHSSDMSLPSFPRVLINSLKDGVHQFDGFDRH